MSNYVELVDKLRRLSKNGTRYGIAVITMSEAADAIEELQLKQKHGTWKMKELYQGVCSECGHKQRGDQFNNTYIFKPKNYKYCPNCGANMQEE